MWGSLSSGCGCHLAPAPLKIPDFILKIFFRIHNYSLCTGRTLVCGTFDGSEVANGEKCMHDACVTDVWLLRVTQGPRRHRAGGPGPGARCKAVARFRVLYARWGGGGEPERGRGCGGGVN